MTATSLIRVTSVTLRAVLTLALALWLQPSELGQYAVIAATLTLTVYLYGLDFQTFTMRELSTADLAGARLRIRDQFIMLSLIYGIGSVVLAAILATFAMPAHFLILVVLIAAVQHAALEFYRILTRLGRPVAGAAVLLIRDAAWVPFCLGLKLATGTLALSSLLGWWLAGSVASGLFGALVLVRWLPPASRRPVDLAWLASGLRTGLRMLVGTLCSVALFTVDRMLFASLAPPDVLGAYALFALGCAALQGLFETAILPAFWSPLLQAKEDRDEAAYHAAERRLTLACLAAAALTAVGSVFGLTVLTRFLPHPSYASNLHLLYYVAAAYSLIILTNIPHYRLYAARLDSLIVTAKIAAFATFLALVALIAAIDPALAVPVALVSACALLFMIEWVMAQRKLGGLASTKPDPRRG